MTMSTFPHLLGYSLHTFYFAHFHLHPAHVATSYFSLYVFLPSTCFVIKWNCIIFNGSYPDIIDINGRYVRTYPFTSNSRYIVANTVFNFLQYLFPEGNIGRVIMLYIEYHSVCPLVRIGSPRPISRKRVCPPRNQGATLDCGWGVADAIRTTGEKAWHSVYSVNI